MIGRYYDHIGTEKGVKFKIGDGLGVPNLGPAHVKFIDKNTLAVKDKLNKLTIQRITGEIVCEIESKLDKALYIKLGIALHEDEEYTGEN